MKTLKVIDLGVSSYNDAYLAQKNILGNIRQNRSDDTVVLAEHPSVFTIGRSGSRSNLLVNENILRERGIEVLEVDRGGDITFHGMGQLVAYPIFDLSRHAKDVRLLLKNLKYLLGIVVSEYGLTADRKAGHTGLWVDGEKIGFIGIGIRNWISYHGISINANVDLDYFAMIKPCGIDGVRIGSLHKILNRHIDLILLKDILLKKFREVFGFERLQNSSENAFLVEEKAS